MAFLLESSHSPLEVHAARWSQASVGRPGRRGDPKGARRAARLGVLAAFCAAATTAGGLMVARPWIARLYSHDADVVELTSRCVPALALLVFFDAQNVCVQGTLSGAGAPQRIAVSNLVGWYVVGAPTALGLLFGLELDAGAAPVLLACCGLAATSLAVPPVLGFGDKGAPKRGVPPYAPLDYTIELLGINGNNQPR